MPKPSIALRGSLRSWALWVGAVASCALPVSLAWAATYSGMRCEGKLVSRGDSAARVLRRCGDPDHVAARSEWRTLRRKVVVPCSIDSRHRRRNRCEVVEEISVEVPLEDWTYDFGAQRLIHTATFEAGRLREVKTEGYGSSD